MKPSASAAEIAAVAARARVALEAAADQASQDAAAPTVNDDAEWEYLRSRGNDLGDEQTLHDSTSARDQAYDQAWDDASSAGDTLAAGND